MISKSKKILDGKLIKIELEFSNKIDIIKITGDFFLYPEETILLLENAIKGTEIPINRKDLLTKLNEVLKNNNADLVGVSTKDITDIIEELTNE